MTQGRCKSDCDRVFSMSCATLTTPPLRNVKGQEGACFHSVFMCVCVYQCVLLVSVDPWYVESGDGALTG